MNRRAFLAAGIALLAAPLAAEAQAGRVYRIGYLTPWPLGSSEEEVLWRGLRDLGYVNGQNLVVESRTAEQRHERLPKLAAELLAEKVDVIVTATGTAALAAKGVTSTVPIVMAGSADAVTQGIVESLRRPGGNVTGLTSLSPELGAKRLEVLKQALPYLKRAAALWCPEFPINHEEARQVTTIAQALGIRIQPVEYRTPESWRHTMEAFKANPPEAVFVSDCPSLPLRSIREFCMQQRLPLITPYATVTRRGGLLSYGPDDAAMNRTAATFVDKILKGANPADLPVEQPTKFELVINLKTAKALGLTIPQALLLRADQVIE